MVADEGVGGDAPERSGSEDRHDAVRGSGPQYVHSQVVASKSAPSVTVPLRGPLGRTTARVGPAAAVLRRVGLASLTAGADHPVSEEVSCGQSVAVISAQQNPASSRATAAATTDFTFLRAARACQRADSLTWAFQARATVAAPAPPWRALMVLPIAGRCW